MIIVGCDSSTKAIGLARITETGDLIDTLLLEPQGKRALDRVTNLPDLMPRGTWWDGITHLIIEQQPIGRTTGGWECALIAGAIVHEAARHGAHILPLTPAGWRKQLGWPRMSSEEAKLGARALLRTHMPVLALTGMPSEHEAEAYCIAYAGWLMLDPTRFYYAVT